MPWNRRLEAWRQQLEDWSLHRAAQHGDLEEVVRLLAEAKSLNNFDELGKTPLHYAISGDHLDVVDKLIQEGANVNAHDERVAGNTPLSDNAENCSLKMAKRLVEAGADPTIRGWMQLNATDRAAKRTDPQATKVRALLKKASLDLKHKSKMEK